MIDVLRYRKKAAAAVADYQTRYPLMDDTEGAQAGPSQGIVTCGGGPVYFIQAFVMVTLLRRMGCGLPIECWHWGEAEMTPRMRELLGALDVTPRDAMEIARHEGLQQVMPWVIKPMAVLNSAFDQVLFLDSDCVPVRDPSYLFDDESFQEHGSLFWTDRYRGSGSSHPTVRPTAWALANVPFRDEPECESGQFLCDRRRCERELFLACHFNQNAEVYYQTVYGDKDTFRLAWHRLGREFNTVPFGPSSPAGYRVLYHFDPSGSLIFQHRARSKWSLQAENPRLPGFHRHEDCLAILAELKQHWEPIQSELSDAISPKVATAREEILSAQKHWCRIGNRQWKPVCFHADGSLEIPSRLVPTHWHIMEQPGGDVSLNLVGDRAAPITLYRSGDAWVGQRLAGTRPGILISKNRPAGHEFAADSPEHSNAYAMTMHAYGETESAYEEIGHAYGEIGHAVSETTHAYAEPQGAPVLGDVVYETGTDVFVHALANATRAYSQPVAMSAADASESWDVPMPYLLAAFASEDPPQAYESSIPLLDAPPHHPAYHAWAAVPDFGYQFDIVHDAYPVASVHALSDVAPYDHPVMEVMPYESPTLHPLGHTPAYDAPMQEHVGSGHVYESGALGSQTHAYSKTQRSGAAESWMRSTPTELSPERHAQIKVHGLPRTCTNLLTVQLQRHFDATVYANELGWKHGPNLFRQGDRLHHQPLQTVVCVKHPYSWLVSFYRFDQSAHAYRLPFRDFVRGTCRTYRGHNPVDRFNFLNRMWLAATNDPQHGQIVHSERMQTDQVETLALLESRLRLRRTQRCLRAERRRVGPDEQIRRRAFDPSPYRQQDFLRHFDAELLGWVNNRLDKDIVSRLGYQLTDQPFPFDLLRGNGCESLP